MTEETLADVDHTHPDTDETFGGVYRRGPAVADGAGPEVGADVADEECLGEVDHDCVGQIAVEVWKRGPVDVPEDVDAGADQ